jgi:hypothetical protein
MAVLWRSQAAEAATETHVGGPQSPALTESPGLSMYYTFSGELWQYDGEAPLGFVTLPAELSKDIRAKHGPSATSVGSIKCIGHSWRYALGDTARPPSAGAVITTTCVRTTVSEVLRRAGRSLPSCVVTSPPILGTSRARLPM